MSQIYFLGGSRVEIDLADILSKQLVVTGGILRVRSREGKGALAAAVKDNVWPIIERKNFKPLIHAEFPLVRADEAHLLIESGEHVGKIVLRGN